MPDLLTIQWGILTFENLGPFNGWTGPGGPGIYAVMVKPKPATAPNDYRILYFGEAEELSSSAFFNGHPKIRCCISEAGKTDLLFFAMLPMSGSDVNKRKQAVRELAEQFRPPCNW
jgi:hypothetical protein